MKRRTGRQRSPSVCTGAAPEPLRVTLDEIRSSTTRGKWWLVGAAWAGDPLAEETESSGQALQFQTKEAQGDKELAKLARAQGMNTDIRKGIFNVIMTSEVRILIQFPSWVLSLQATRPLILLLCHRIMSTHATGSCSLA